MNKETLNKLKELAENASPGPWFTQTHCADNSEHSHIGLESQEGAELIGEEVMPCDADMRFIAAANPAAVLELIAKVQIPLEEHNARFAIDGAMWKGHEGVDQPPTEDHWLMPYWQMARELAEFKADAERSSAPVSQMTDERSADDIVTALYRRFKDWSKRGFGPDDVTWCEVKADVMALIASSQQEAEPVAVKVPEMLSAGNLGVPVFSQREWAGRDDGYRFGWNACRAEVLRMNNATPAIQQPAVSQPQAVVDAVNSAIVTPKHIEEIKDLLIWPVTEDDARAARDMLQSIHFDLSMMEPNPGYVIAPDYRGYAHLGLGQYVLNHSKGSDLAELAISIATEAQKAGRLVGDLRDNEPGELVMPEDIAVRIRFENVAGLDALEQQLQLLREVHFPDSAGNAKDAARWRAFRNRDGFDDLDYTMFADAFGEDADEIIDDAMASKQCSGDPTSCSDNEGYGCVCDPMNKAGITTQANCQDGEGSTKPWNDAHADMERELFGDGEAGAGEG